MTRFLRRPISKFLARISLDAVPFFSLQALLTEQIMEVMEQEVTHLEGMESPRKGGAEDDP